MSPSDDRSPTEGEQKNWLANPDLTLGAAPWESRPLGSVTLDPTGPEGRPAARLERALGVGEPVIWYQVLSSLPPRRQLSFSARVRVEEGQAQLWVRCYREDGSEIEGHHRWSAPWASPAEACQSLPFTFVVPPEAARVEVGGALPYGGRAWLADFALHLIPDDEERLRAALVETLARQGSLPTAACRRAFRRVPRHRFLPNSTVAEAYMDVAIPTHTPDAQGRGPVSSSSQPAMMATMLGQLRLRPGTRVLEIGAGTGYNAAILAEIVGAENVVSIDLDEEIVAEARAHLEATGYSRVRVERADGWRGYPAGAPYDRIILTVGVHDLAPAWVEQLRDGGLLVAPLSFGSAQFVPAFRRRGDHLTSEQIRSGFFMDLRGEHPRQMTHRSGEGLTVAHDALSDTALAAVNEILDRPAELFSAPELVEVGTAWAEFQNFWTFVALFHPLAIQIGDPRVSAQGIQGMAYAIADLERHQLALTTACLGGPEIGQELRRLAREWLEMGRPGLDRLVIAAYPRAVYPRADVLPRGHWSGLIEKEHTWFRWRYRQGREQSGQA